MKKLPTDLMILNEIYDRYYEAFTRYTDGDESRSTKIYVPIDIRAIANALKVDSDIIFGRLYYHLDRKHGYKHDDDSTVHLFALRIGRDDKCVNFPLMASVLADLRDQARKHNTAMWIAFGSFVISVIAIFISIRGLL